MGTLLLATGDQMRRLLLLAVSLLAINIFLNGLLIPLYSFNGAATTTFICAAAGFLGRMLLSRAYFGKMPSLMTLAWRPLSASIVMGLFMFLFARTHILIVIPAGLLIYVFVLIVLGEFRQARYMPVRAKVSQFLSNPYRR